MTTREPCCIDMTCISKILAAAATRIRQTAFASTLCRIPLATSQERIHQRLEIFIVLVSFVLRLRYYHRRCSGLYRGAREWVINRFIAPRSTIASARPDIDAAALHQSTGAHRHVLFHHIQWEAL